MEHQAQQQQGLQLQQNHHLYQFQQDHQLGQQYQQQQRQTEQDQHNEQVQQQDQQLNQNLLTLRLKNLVQTHFQEYLKVALDSEQSLVGPLATFIGNDFIFHGSFAPYGSFDYPSSEVVACVAEYSSCLSRNRPVFPVAATDLSGFKILDTSDSINSMDMPLEHLIRDTQNKIALLRSSLNVSESRATASAYLPIFFEAFEVARKYSSLYRPSFDDVVEFQVPIQYLKESSDSNWSCHTALCNDIRPNMSLTVGEKCTLVAFVQVKVFKDEFESDFEKAVGLAVAGFRDILCIARTVLIHNSEDLNETSLSFLNRCASGNFVFPFATCHNDIVTFYCVSLNTTSQTKKDNFDSSTNIRFSFSFQL